MSGKLIVFEGTDGSGKATQSKLLCQYLEAKGIPFRHIDFPRYGKPSAAMVQEYLDGNLGKKPEDVNAYAASMFYAMDRYASYKQDWGTFYDEGGLVVADRYTTSNAVHQSAKLPEGEREAFCRWLDEFEHDRLELPRPDLVIYLDMPTDFSVKLLRSREQATSTTADIHEVDSGYLAACRTAALQAAGVLGWTVIPCVREGKLRSIEDIHAEIWSHIEAIL